MKSYSPVLKNESRSEERPQGTLLVSQGAKWSATKPYLSERRKKKIKRRKI